MKISGCAVADDYSHELGDSSEALLSAALGYGSGGTCPAVTASAVAARAASAKTGSLAITKPDPWIMSVNQNPSLPRR